MKPILVIDDEPVVLEMMQMLLEGKGFSVMPANSADQGLELVRNSELHAVLLDLGLGDRSGMDVLQEIKRIKPGLSVIICTGHHDERDARSAREKGALDFIKKPVDFVYLTKVLMNDVKG